MSRVSYYDVRMSYKKNIIVKAILIFLAFLLGIYVFSIVRWPREGEFKGTLTYAFEIHDFQPDKSFEHWWLEGHEAFQETIYSDLNGRKVNWDIEKPQYKMKIRGKLSSIGKHGSYGQWRRELTIDKILECKYIGNKPDSTRILP